MAVIPFPARNKLAYPAGRAPGFDPSHPAVPGLNGFILPVPGQALNLAGMAQFGKGTVNGTFTANIDQCLGPSLQHAGSGNHIAFNAPTLPTTAAGTGYTFASIGRPLNVGATTVFISIDDPEVGASGLYQGISSPSGTFFVRLTGTVSFDSGVVAVTGIPYFYAVSLIYRGANLWDHNHVILRLDTGQLVKASVVGTSAAAISFSSALFRYGGSSTFGASVVMGPAMTSTTVLSMAQLVQWAQDPWAFWYPPKGQDRVAAAAAAAAANNFTNLLLMGVG